MSDESVSRTNRFVSGFLDGLSNVESAAVGVAKVTAMTALLVGIGLLAPAEIAFFVYGMIGPFSAGFEQPAALLWFAAWSAFVTYPVFSGVFRVMDDD
jgi:hypothetical protein